MSSELNKIIEGVLFAADRPLAVDDILNLFEEQERPERTAVKAALEQLLEHYAGRGVELKEIANGYQFQTQADLSPWVSRLWEERAPRYSRALLETLALVAYRQPITRGEVEEIRGVAVSTNIMRTLIEREWVKVVGHKEVPGRPSLYATTKEFLDYFNLKSLQDLPSLAEVVDLDEAGKKLEASLKAEQEAAEAEALAAAQLDPKPVDPDHPEAAASDFDDEADDIDIDDEALAEAMSFAKAYDVNAIINPEADDEEDDAEGDQSADDDQNHNEKATSEV